MDEKDLKNILSGIQTPPAGDNARKRAANLALAEYEAAGKESERNIKGSRVFSRLTGRTTEDKRRDPMRKNYVFKTAGALVAVYLFTGATYQGYMRFVHEPTPNRPSSQYGNEFSTIAENIVTSQESLPGIVDPLGLFKKPEQKTSVAEMNAVGFNVGGPAEPPASGKIHSRQASRRDSIAGAAPMMAMESMAMVDSDFAVQPGYQDVGRDKFEDFEENQIKIVKEEPVSTFSIDVDTSSYAFMRRQINNGLLPQKDAVRIEEMINYFDYDYPLPETRDEPFKPSVTVVPSPWANGKKLVHIGIKGYDIAPEEKPRSNLVFLLDVSGSMNAQDKLPLLKNSFKLLLDTLEADDTVAIVVYAGAAGTVLEPTKVGEKHKILNALDRLSAGGSTAGAEGIRQAYQLAEANFIKDGVNRIMLATDGDFNVGITNREELKDFVERKRESGIFLSILGFGQGNLNDHMMQTLAQNGNGIAAYIDSLNEARKVLVEEASSTLFPIAKDVKIQVEFNPDTVAEYRLIGYETRALNREDFNNDQVDAGDIGSGHTVTAIYEITPVGGPRTVDESRYTASAEKHKADTDFGDEYAFLKIRYKNPDEDTSKLITTPITTESEIESLETANADTRFATAVATFGQLLKGGKYTGDISYQDIIDLAQNARGNDPFGYRSEFLNLVRLAKSAASLQQSAPVKN